MFIETKAKFLHAVVAPESRFCPSPKRSTNLLASFMEGNGFGFNVKQQFLFAPLTSSTLLWIKAFVMEKLKTPHFRGWIKEPVHYQHDYSDLQDFHLSQYVYLNSQMEANYDVRIQWTFAIFTVTYQTSAFSGPPVHLSPLPL